MPSLSYESDCDDTVKSPSGLREDLHGHNNVFIVYSVNVYIIQRCDRNKVLNTGVVREV